MNMTDSEPQIELHIERLDWNLDRPQAENLLKLGKALASRYKIYRMANDPGKLVILDEDGSFRYIQKPDDLYTLIMDTFDLRVIEQGNVKNKKLSAELKTAFTSKFFLNCFFEADRISNRAMYDTKFELCQSGYNMGVSPDRTLHLGSESKIRTNMVYTNMFLDQMNFLNDSDRANTLAAKLTVLLRNHWPGAKPCILVSANKSHSGKDTVMDFIVGRTDRFNLTYSNHDWTIEMKILKRLKSSNGMTGFIGIDNVRTSKNLDISSAFLEGMITSETVHITNPTGKSDCMKFRNELVVGFTVNNGQFSPDLLNRGLPIQLFCSEDVHERTSTIGNPRNEFLPKYQLELESELLGMVEKWKAEGAPLDEDIKHSFDQWAKTVGGILKVNGVKGFMKNRKTLNNSLNPEKEAIGALGSFIINQLKHDNKRHYNAGQLVEIIQQAGLTNDFFKKENIGSELAASRRLGKFLTNHVGEKFIHKDDEFEAEFYLKKTDYRIRIDGNQNASYLYYLESGPQNTPLTEVMEQKSDFPSTSQLQLEYHPRVGNQSE